MHNNKTLLKRSANKYCNFHSCIYILKFPGPGVSGNVCCDTVNIKCDYITTQ